MYMSLVPLFRENTIFQHSVIHQNLYSSHHQQNDLIFSIDTIRIDVSYLMW